MSNLNFQKHLQAHARGKIFKPYEGKNTVSTITPNDMNELPKQHTIIDPNIQADYVKEIFKANNSSNNVNCDKNVKMGI